MTWYRLAGPDGDGQWPYLNERGAFLGQGTPLLDLFQDASGRPVWRPRPIAELNHLLSIGYGIPVDFADRRSGLAALAKAVTEGDQLRATIHLVFLRLPALPDPEAAPRMAKADAALKANFNPGELRDGRGRWTGNGSTVAYDRDCNREWAQASAKCVEWQLDGTLGRPFSFLGRTVEECARGKVSERCGGNSVEW